MNKRFFLVLSFLVIVSVMFFCCKKSSGEQGPARPEQRNNSNSSTIEPRNLELRNNDNNSTTRSYSTSTFTMERIQVLHTINAISEQLPEILFSTNAHLEHLNDPLTFVNLPDGGIPNGRTAVVGSDVCLFYPVDSISSRDELYDLPEGEPIPFATIIPLEDDGGRRFNFQDNFNCFYKTTWNGKQGIVFGADLYGVGSSNMENRINALLYKDNGHFDSFYPVTGYDEIGTGILGELQTNGIVFQEVKPSEYDLSIERPDDMISLYTKIQKSVTPVFITTDLAAHANHLVFDHTLQYIEENFFFPGVVTLTDEYIKAIEQKEGTIPEEVYTTALQYFQVAQALLALAPRKVETKRYSDTVIELQDVDEAQVLQNYPQPVVEEIENINEAAGFGSSSIVGMSEDYSQYKVRGHYTKNKTLGAYFRALMWYGRINFNLGGEGTGRIEDFSARLSLVALFITDITENSPELKSLWQSLFDPITEFIGASDDISFYELIPLWNRIKGAGFAQWYNDPNKRGIFTSSDYKELRQPAISGSSILLAPASGGPEPENRLPPMGWRLFGQRYTFDSEIHGKASRDMVKGLDILKVFGSQTADRLLRESDYSKMPSLERTLNLMQQNLRNAGDDFWLSTYYTNILYQIKTLGLFENGAGFYFTEKPGWNIKAMNAAHGTWAELRHDTILYVKQSYAERGGGDGENESTFRTKPLPEPIHYLEPNIPFWITSAMGLQKLYTILEKYNHLDGRTAQVLAGMHSLFVKAAEISRLEADNQEVSRKDLNWISTIPWELARLVVTPTSTGYVDDIDALRMALVADGFTNAEIGAVLETAVCIPYRLYIPLNDRQGGKRIAVGYGFSYYEFSHPMSNRLNNDEWKAVVYGDNPNMTQYLPFWMRGKVQPAR
ncbi:MAG: DUF3160 domain-containing protein [Treponema sp.]|nr:DUF3160 domain-containing protein [Treponema sp.]